MTANDPIFDHAVSVTFENIADPVERVRFFRANKSALARESARRDAGRALPAAAPMPKPFKLMKSGRDFRTVPAGGIFGALK